MGKRSRNSRRLKMQVESHQLGTTERDRRLRLGLMAVAVANRPVEQFQTGQATTTLIDTTPELFTFKTKRDRATKLLNFLGNVIVNGNPHAKGYQPPKKGQPKYPYATMKELLAHVGRVIRLPEQHLDAITATSGSGPAYFFLLAEAMIEACILLGLSRDVATELIIQTMLGSAKMLRDTGTHPVELREMVTSPGGTTIAAIRELEQAGVRAAFLNAIQAAMKRSKELAEGG